VHLFDRYLLREWFQIVGLVIAALLGLLLVQLMYSELPGLLDKGASLSDIAIYFGVAVPSFLALLLPLTLLVSTLYCFGQMHRSHEFTALRAAGVSLVRISMPVWCVGLLCCGLTGWLNSGLVPWSVEESRVIKERLSFKVQSGHMPEDRIGAQMSVSFDNRRQGRMWFMNRYSRYTEKAYGVRLSYLNGRRLEERRLVASVAFPNPKGKGWIFQRGRDLRFDTASGDLVSNQPFAELLCPELGEDPRLMLLIDRKATELSLPELERLISHLEETHNPKIVPYLVRYHSLLADIISPLIVIGLSIPFAVAGVRVNPAVGMSKSIGLFALYYLFAQLGSSLATKGLLDPVSAAWLPSMAMAALALWFFVRLR
jgi:lipopolysaccharide export system permease protein